VSDALKFEWTRLKTLRSTYWLIGMGLAASALIAFVVGLAASDEPLNAEILAMALNGGAMFGIPFMAVFMAIVGIFATGHEWRHGTVQPTLTALPQRSRLILAKLLVVSVTAVLATLASMLINLGVVFVFWGEAPGLFDAPLNEALPGYVLYTLIYAIVGLGLGLLFRGVPSALVVIFLMPLIIEGLITGLAMLPALDWLAPVVKFLPFSAGSQLMTTSSNEMQAVADFDLFGRWAAGGVFAAFAAIVLGSAWYLFERRDA
jgi:ABC-2 type transport system permease protein